MKTPALNKQANARKKAQVIGEFLDWVHNKKGWRFCEAKPPKPGFTFEAFLPVACVTERLLAEYFGIDEAAVENERRALLAEMRHRHEHGGCTLKNEQPRMEGV